MLVREIMSGKPEYIPPQSNLVDVATLMRDKHYGFTPVGENDRLIGVITDRDITIRAVADGADIKSAQVKDFMTSKILYCFEEDDLKKACKNMHEQKIHRLIVLNNPKEKRIVGILSLSDIAKKCDDKELSWKIAQCASEEAK